MCSMALAAIFLPFPMFRCAVPWMARLFASVALAVKIILATVSALSSSATFARASSSARFAAKASE